MAIFTGAGIALITPMLADGTVDFDKLKELAEWHVQQGADAIIACGTTGEASTLDDQEHIAVIEAVVKQVNGRIPVIGGTGSNNTQHGIELSQAAQRVGADALLVVTPYYNKATKKSIIKHYQAICASVDLPVILYSVASRTGMNLTPAIVKELKEIPNVVGIKEASGDISQIVEIARLVDEDFALYSGNDDQVLPLLSVGGSGVISTIGNIAPKQTSQMVLVQLAQKPLIDAIFSEVNPVPIKKAVGMLKGYDTYYRLPLDQPEEETVELLAKEMKNYGLL